MPDVIDERLFADARPLPPGGEVHSRRLDVRGAQHVNITVGISTAGGDANVECTIFFGRTDEFFPMRTDAFSQTNFLSTSVPVFGPQLMVEVKNNGNQATNCDGTVYAVREVP